jgi:hypothetical protein
MKHNRVLGKRFAANMVAFDLVDAPPDPNMGSSDMGNVSWLLPTIHPCLAICDTGTPGHSILFRDAAATPRADDTTLLAATPSTAVDLLLTGARGGCLASSAAARYFHTNETGRPHRRSDFERERTEGSRRRPGTPRGRCYHRPCCALLDA